MLKPVRILIFLSLSFAASIACADSNAGWKIIIDRLLASGVQKIGSFDLQKFRDAALKIDEELLHGAPPSVFSGSRQSGYNRCGDKKIHVVDRLPTEAISSRGELELHERLGVLCYNDADTAMSSALNLLSAMNDSPQRRELIHKFEQSVFQRPLRVAGGTGISGGGDLVTIYVKAEVLRLIMGDAQNRLNATSEFLSRYASIRFEPLQSHLPRTVYVQWSLSRKGGESFSVFIPMEVWKKGDGARTALIRETARKIMELFPSYAQNSVRTFHPSSCSGHETATYPMTEDAAVRQIQDARAGFLLGCRKFFPGQTGFSVVAPALPSDQEPKPTGFYHFTCSFRFDGGQPIISHVNSVAGKNQSSTVPPNSTPSGEYMMADLLVKADGKILGTRVIAHKNGQPLSAKDIPPITPPTDATHSTTTTVIEGHMAVFSCQRDP